MFLREVEARRIRGPGSWYCTPRCTPGLRGSGNAARAGPAVAGDSRTADHIRSHEAILWSTHRLQFLISRGFVVRAAGRRVDLPAGALGGRRRQAELLREFGNVEVAVFHRVQQIRDGAAQGLLEGSVARMRPRSPSRMLRQSSRTSSSGPRFAPSSKSPMPSINLHTESLNVAVSAPATCLVTFSKALFASAPPGACPRRKLSPSTASTHRTSLRPTLAAPDSVGGPERSLGPAEPARLRAEPSRDAIPVIAGTPPRWPDRRRCCLIKVNRPDGASCFKNACVGGDGCR